MSKIKREQFKRTLPLPSREQVNKNGWLFQIDFMYDGQPCFERVKSVYARKQVEARLERYERHFAVTDLRHADLMEKIEKINNPVW